MSNLTHGESIHRLALVATEIAARAPLQLSPAAEFVTVDARLIREARALLEGMGIDWRSLCEYSKT